jgi:Photosynthetic reaction centre cytochrome C subunit
VKLSSLSAAATALMTAAIFAVSAAAQAPPQSPAGGPSHAQASPTNLKVLSKDLTMRQVHEIMEGWAGSLGVHCDACHIADPNNVGPNGRPRMNFADDSKPEKEMARIMYTMTTDINKNYVAKVMAMDKMDTPAAPVSCGTCHRGHLDPEPFVVPPEEHGPRPAQSAPPAAATPPPAQ